LQGVVDVSDAYLQAFQEGLGGAEVFGEAIDTAFQGGKFRRS